MFQVVEAGKVSAPLSPVMPMDQSNMEFIGQYVGVLLKKAFPHLNE